MSSDSVDLTKYQFSVIYSVDVPRGASLDQYTPPHYSKRGWYCTEREASEVLGMGRHRKHCAILFFEDFCEFLEGVGLSVEPCHTMGSVGAPGFGIGWSPAVPFNGADNDAYQSAYVTPIPPEGEALPAFEAVEQAMWEWFEDGGYSAREYAQGLQDA